MTMHAIVVQSDEHRSMVWAEVEQPRPVAGEALVRVRATAVNRADLLQRIGKYPPPPGITEVMGLEAAGEVVELGPGTAGSHGQRVCCLLAGGGYAEYAVCPVGQLFPIPGEMSFEQAAALPEVLLTAFLNLYMEAELKQGEVALVHAGASGVGTAAQQICRAFGNRVYATASASKLDQLGALGASAAIDREAEDFVARIEELTDGRGVDVILDVVGGGGYLERNIRSLAPEGRLVVIGLLGGLEGTLPLQTLLRKRLRVIGSVLRSRSVAEKDVICARAKERLWPAVERGEIKPVIFKALPIERVKEAHALLKTNRTVGKIVLMLGD